MNINDFGKMMSMLQMGAQPVGDVVKGPPNWFNQDLPVKGLDPLAEAMGRQGMAPSGSKWFGGWKPPAKAPSAKDSAQTSFAPGVTITPRTPGEVIAGMRSGRAGTTSVDPYVRWSKEWNGGQWIDPVKLGQITRGIEASGRQPSRDEFLFMLAKLRQEGEL